MQIISACVCLVFLGSVVVCLGEADPQWSDPTPTTHWSASTPTPSPSLYRSPLDISPLIPKTLGIEGNGDSNLLFWPSNHPVNNLVFSEQKVPVISGHAQNYPVVPGHAKKSFIGDLDVEQFLEELTRMDNTEMSAMEAVDPVSRIQVEIKAEQGMKAVQIPNLEAHVPEISPELPTPSNQVFIGPQPRKEMGPIPIYAVDRDFKVKLEKSTLPLQTNRANILALGSHDQLHMNSKYANDRIDLEIATDKGQDLGNTVMDTIASDRIDMGDDAYSQSQMLASEPEVVSFSPIDAMLTPRHTSRRFQRHTHRTSPLSPRRQGQTISKRRPVRQITVKTINSPAGRKRELAPAQARMDFAQGVDPALLQAVLADPVLLQAVDPRVLQAVLVSAAQANLALQHKTENEVEAEKAFPKPAGPPPQPFPPRPPTPPPNRRPTTPRPVPAVPDRATKPLVFQEQPRESEVEVFDPSRLENMQRPLTTQEEFSSDRKSPTRFSAADIASFTTRRPDGPIAFGPQFNPAQPSAIGQQFGQSALRTSGLEDFQTGFGQTLLNQFDQSNNGNQQISFGKLRLDKDPNQQQPSEIKFQSLQFKQQQSNPLQELEQQQQQQPQQQNLERQQQDSTAQNARQLLAGQTPLTQIQQQQLFGSQQLSDELQKLLSRNSELSQQLFGPPPPALGIIPPGVCSLVTATGIPCDPGLAFNPVTGSCEWPDTLIEAGCNPETVTGFGPCPQEPLDTLLNTNQVLSWPQPKFPVNLDVVTVQNFDAILAKKYFIVCVPTLYGKLFPRLLCCPDYHHYDPVHIDGCVPDFLPPPPYHHDLPLHHHDLPPPLYGNPDPHIHHIGEPLPLGAPVKRSLATTQFQLDPRNSQLHKQQKEDEHSQQQRQQETQQQQQQQQYHQHKLQQHSQHQEQHQNHHN